VKHPFAALVALAAGLVASQAAALSQAAPSLPTGDPANALWSFLGSGTVAGVLYLWIRSEKADRVEERTERRAATTAKDALMAKLVDLVEADAANKATIRERLKGQDDVLTRLVVTVERLEKSIAVKRAPRREAPTGGGG
jgi:hypothetical protein